MAKKNRLPMPLLQTAEEEAAFGEPHDKTGYALEEVAEPLTLIPKLEAPILNRWRQRKGCTVLLTPMRVNGSLLCRRWSKCETFLLLRGCWSW